MKIQPYFDKLSQSPAYQGFAKENPDAFMVAGFFVLDLESQKNIHQLDFYVPSKKKIAAFSLDGDIVCQMVDAITNEAPGKIEPKVKTDLDELQGIIEDEMKNRNMSEQTKKIIAILQNHEGKKIWNVSAILSGLHILRAHIEDKSKTVLKMEKASMMDFIKQVNPQQVQSMGSQVQPTASQTQPPQDKEQAMEQEVEKLDKLEKAIEKEKSRLKKEMKKKK